MISYLRDSNYFDKGFKIRYYDRIGDDGGNCN